MDYIISKIKEMKNNIKVSILLGLFILVFACKKNAFLDLIVAGEHPFGNTTIGDVFKSYEFDSVKTILVKVPKLSEWNIFYKKAGKETFLTNYCHSDCNEQLNKFELSKNGIYFAMLIENSNRYPHSTRLFF